MKELVNLLKEIFPSVSQETTTNTLKAIEENFNDSRNIEFFSDVLLEELSQGDILSNITFVYIDDQGMEQELPPTYGMILSYSCDIDNKTLIQVAAVRDINELGANPGNIRNNEVTNILYIPTQRSDLTDYAVDLSLVTSISPKAVRAAIMSGEINRIGSLNLRGYYLLLLKLTLHFLRPEDGTTNAEREE